VSRATKKQCFEAINSHLLSLVTEGMIKSASDSFDTLGQTVCLSGVLDGSLFWPPITTVYFISQSEKNMVQYGWFTMSRSPDEVRQ
jgi:hypothetical protein